MTRRTPVSVSSVPRRQRRSSLSVRRTSRRTPPGTRYLGFTCFRLETYDEPDLDFAFRKLHGTRNAMGVFATRAVPSPL